VADDVADDPMVGDAMAGAPMLRPGRPGALEVYEGPPAVLQKIYEAAAVNAAPPAFLMPVGTPEWNGSPGGWILGGAIFLAAGVASVAYWLTVLVVWSVLHVLMWIFGHPKRVGFAAAAFGVVYVLTHR
jgi:hypothetical protein